VGFGAGGGAAAALRRRRFARSAWASFASRDSARRLGILIALGHRPEVRRGASRVKPPAAI
jgi:hypothetical protein